MFFYVLRRILWAIPTLLLISLLTFWMSQCAPRDPRLEYGEHEFKSGGYQNQVPQMIAEARKQNLFLPDFYFTITLSAFPDTLYKILPLSRRNKLVRQTAKSGNWAAQIRFEQFVWIVETKIAQLPDSLPQKRPLNAEISKLFSQFNFDTLSFVFKRMHAQTNTLPEMEPWVDSLEAASSAVLNQKTPQKLWLPAFYWNGTLNRYHQWLSHFLRGDWGRSRSMDRPIWQELRPALWASMTLSVISISLAYLIAIPLGVFLARYRKHWIDPLIQSLLLFFYAMPMFVLGALITGLFVSDAAVFPLIRSFSINPLEGSGKYALIWFFENMPVMMLPVLVILLHALAILTLQMRGGILEVIGQDYIRTAWAKGSDARKVYWTHALRNAIFPVIATFSSLFPAIFAGTVIVERLFNIYGLGSKTISAIQNADYPMLFIIVLLTALISVVANLLADLLFAYLDPRIRFTQS